MMTQARYALTALALAASTILPGCTPYPRLEAAWYLNYAGPSVRSEAQPAQNTPEAVGSAIKRDDPPDEQIDDIYVAILNAGRRSASIYEVFMDPSGTDKLFPEKVGVHSLARGKILVMPVKVFNAKAAAKRPCTIPVRLYIRSHPQKRKLQQVKLTGSMPTSLPSAWIDDCRDTGSVY